MEAEGAQVSTYCSGDWVAVVGPRFGLLLDSDPGDQLTQKVWEATREEDGPAVVEALLRSEATKRPLNLALAAESGSGVILLLCGSGFAEVDAQEPDRDVQMRCPANVSLAQLRLAEIPDHVVLGGGGVVDSVLFPLESGIARAGTLVLEWSRSSARPTSQLREAQHGHLRDHKIQVASPDGSKANIPAAVELPGPDTPTSQLREEGNEEGVSEWEEPFSLTVDPGVTLSAAVDLPEIDPLPASPGLESRSETEVPVAGNGEPNTEEKETYDHLFGRTLSRTVEDAAVRPLEVVVPATLEEEKSEEPPILVELPITTPAAFASPDPPTEIIRAPSSGLIDSVPGMAKVDVPPASLNQDREEAPIDHEMELTISRAAQRALLEKVTASPTGLVGPVVHAVQCPSLHPNPANANSCRVCGVPIAEQPPITLPRPVLGRLQLSSGGEVTLDRGVLMGRGPSDGRQVGGERPHLVKLPSPDNGISRDHLEVLIDGWHVLVTDLNSTNGTLITQPGRSPRRLSPDQPTMIEPGTIVTLADDISFTFEVS
jgi:hypothetical protein